MPLQKQNLSINFSQGLDTKTDPNQVSPGKMLVLQNSVFNKGGLLQKRNGYQGLPTLGATDSTTLTTFHGNLVAIGTNLNALSLDSNQWINSGSLQSLSLDVLPLVRTSTSQTTVDVALATNGLACAVYFDSNSNSYYQIVDSNTGQIIVGITQLPSTAHVPRVFVLGSYFVITFIATVSASPHLRYVSVPLNNPTSPGAAIDISTQVSSLTGAYDGYVANSNLYVAWNGSDMGGAVRMTYIDSTLTQHGTTVLAGESATYLSVTADTTSTPVIWISYWGSGSMDGFATARDQNLGAILAPTQIITNQVIVALTSAARSGVMHSFYEVSNDYSYASVRTDYVETVTITQAGVVGTPAIVDRGIGLGSKAFYFSGTAKFYFLASYGQAFQPTYFLVDSTGNVIAKLAYSNGSGYAISQILPSVTIQDASVSMGYLIKDLLVPVNKEQGVANVAGIYSQTGINLATFTINNDSLIPSEVGNDLHITGGFLWMYDGVKPVEHGFHVWPEDVAATTSTTGGSITDQQYFYQFTYEWTDAQGNLHRSAPSVPISVTTSGGNTSTNTINVPTLRLTYKTGQNVVRIVGYRWSVAQQVYYQFTSITSPVVNNPAVDSVAIVDTLADSSILGNVILYTTGGVVENIAAPACSTLTLFKSRLFLVDSEDPNLIWYSKQVIETTPVEMSDLFTIFISPTIGAQGSTGPITALSSLDDKLIIFKKDAIYYLVGNGPDNTGANNDFSEPVFITATVGSDNQKSIVFTPEGLIFESDKGRWLLGRDLSTTYIGAPVETYNGATTESAVNVPGTNQVRITLDNGITLMYDYFYRQWGTFVNIPAVSSTIFQGLHTYLNTFGQTYQENPGSYLDGANPVLMSFTTGWFSLAGLQGFERAYFFFLLGQYITPHKLNVGLAYDYDPSVVQTTLLSPTNFSPVYGGDSLYGGSSVYGGPSAVEQWKVFLQRQKCQAFQISVSEVYDASFGVMAGAGFTLSGINLVLGAKGGFAKLPATQNAG